MNLQTSQLKKQFIERLLGVVHKRNFKFLGNFELTMKTSNSSRHLNGASIASQSAMMKDTVAKDLSPPERDFVLLLSPFFA